MLGGHVQTIFGKINVIMTLRRGGGVACDANFFCVYCFLIVTITPIFCCNYTNYTARVILLRS